MRETRAGSLHHGLEHVFIAACGGASESGESPRHAVPAARGLEAFQTLYLCLDLAPWRRLQGLALKPILVRHTVPVDADDRLGTSFHFLLEGQRQLAADALYQTGLNRRIHAARRVDARDHL